MHTSIENKIPTMKPKIRAKTIAMANPPPVPQSGAMIERGGIPQMAPPINKTGQTMRLVSQIPENHQRAKKICSRVGFRMISASRVGGLGSLSL